MASSLHEGKIDCNTIHQVILNFKEEKKEKEGRKEHKEKSKDEKERKIHMLKGKKKSKHHKIHQPAGNSLQVILYMLS